MAATSLASHIGTITRAGQCRRHISARLVPVTMPSLAESAWNSMATRFAATTTQSSA